MAAAPIALAHAFGRLGCFLGGCCFGAVTDSPLAVRFPQWSAAYRQHRTEHTDALRDQAQAMGDQLSLPVHPTQLYEVGANLLIFAILFFVVRKSKRFHGHVFGVMLTLYAVARFSIEFFRADARGEWLLGLSTSQLIALPLLALGLWLLWRGRDHKELMDDGQDPPQGRSPLETTQAPPAQMPQWGEGPAPLAQGWPLEQQKVLARVQGQEPPTEADHENDQDKQG
jgi:prolipoprotein diacylglyceryltransferase